MKHRLKIFVPLAAFLAVWIAWSCACAALSLPSSPQYYVNDYAGILNPNVRQSLERRLQAFEEQTSNQILIAIFPSLEGESLEDVSIRLADQWKMGQKGRDNGVLLLIFKEDRKLRIEVGYGLEGVLTDALSKSIILNEIVPFFKQGDYSGGVQSGVAAIMKATQGEYQGLPQAKEEGSNFWGLLFLILIFFILPPLLRRRRFSGITFGSGGWGGGSWGGGSGGGFGGGGGGGFGGGGSSGSW